MTSTSTANSRFYPTVSRVCLLHSPFSTPLLLSSKPSTLTSKQVHEDPIEPLERIQELETENTTLRHRLETLERQIQSRSSPISKALSSFSPPPLFTTPTRHNPPSPLSARRSTNNNNNDEELESDSELHTTMFKLNAMNLSPKPKPKHNSKAGPTPGTGRKMRKLTARKWDLMDENELEVEGYE